MYAGLHDKLMDPWAIQRMDMVSKDCNVRFSERFKNDCMGASEFEQGGQARCIRAMAEGDCVVDTMKVGGINLVVAWRPSVSTKEEIKSWLEKLYFGQFHPHDPTYFNAHQREIYVADVKQWEHDPFREGRRSWHQFTNAWFDIENCIFWTWEKCNPRDIYKNLKKSLEYMNKKREERVT